MKKIVKKGLGTILLSTTVFMSGCSNVDCEYYVVRENNHSYICTRQDVYVNYDDYDYQSIVNHQVIGSICSKRGNFNYNNHKLSTNFLNELQVIPLDTLLAEQNIDTSFLNNNDDYIAFAKSKELDIVTVNHFILMNYPLQYNFIYNSPSDLQLFVSGSDIIVGYDISPDRDFKNNRYIYSIKDMDVIIYKANVEVQTYSIDRYISDNLKKKGSISYNDALGIIETFKRYDAKIKIKEY